MNRAVFLDRDGTINKETEYLHKVEEVILFPGAGHALARLTAAGYKLIIVTNQSGIGRGYYTVAEMEKVNAHIVAELARSGARVDKVYFAPEAPDQPSRGRKPSPQFLFDARDEMAIDLSRSYIIGDKLIDLECGWNAGVAKSILVRTGYGAGYEKKNPAAVQKAWVVDDLSQAADLILKHNP